jgi:DNA-binding transcriptional LysR family regulator
MDLRKLRSFVAAAELNSFTAASKSVNLTQSAVSQQIKDLEEELGCKLIDRNTRPISVTKEGAELAVIARQMLNLWYGIKVRKKEKEVSGSILLGYVRSAITDDLARALYLIRQKYPMVTIQLIYTEGITKLLAQKVAERKLDAALGVATSDLPKGTFWRSYSSEKYFVVAPIHYQGNTDEALLTQGPYIRFKPHLLAETVMDHEIKRRGINVKKVMELDDYESILVMVENHLGVGVVQEHFLTKGRLTKLKRVPFGLPPLLREGGIIARRNNPNNPLVDLLWNSLRSVQ